MFVIYFFEFFAKFKEQNNVSSAIEIWQMCHGFATPALGGQVDATFLKVL